jgi:aspartyl aminopeptidase
LSAPPIELVFRSLYDTQPSVLGGMSNEFVFSPRLDNLFSSYVYSSLVVRGVSFTVVYSFCAVEALAEASASPGNVNCIALFNHEEIGSVSTSGAESSMIPTLLNRLSPTPEALSISISKSFLISADMGHALHPNYESKHELNHQPKINGGIVIKTNAKQRYATDALSSFALKQLIEKKGGQVQEYEVRNDM